VEDGLVELVLSEPVFAEIREVLERPELKPRRKGRLTSRMVDEILVWIRDHSVWISNVPEVFHYDRDPNDEPYLNLAIAAGATYLVSRDRDLLDLQDAESSAGRELRTHLPQVTILDPVQFLQYLAPAPDRR